MERETMLREPIWTPSYSGSPEDRMCVLLWQVMTVEQRRSREWLGMCAARKLEVLRIGVSHGVNAALRELFPITENHLYVE
jgi:hypothetical protein